MLKLSAGLLILLIALALQFWFASSGIYLNLAFATLISFAFVFDIWELIVLVLIAVFTINWQPAASPEILILALFPVAVHLSRNILHWQPWIENILAVTLGFLVIYFVMDGRSFLNGPYAFLTDLGAGLIFGSLVLFPLYHWERT